MVLPRLSALAVCSFVLAIAQSAHAQDVHRYFDRGLWHEATPLQDGTFAVQADGHVFRAGLGTDRVLITLRASLDLAQLDLVVDEVLSERARIFAVRSARGEDVFALAERLAPSVQRGELASAMPDMAQEHVRADITIPPDDPLYSGQWFYQTIHLADAWRHEDGDPSTTIAIVDDGCDLTHPDLAAHLLQGYDAFDDDTDPSYLPASTGNNHGTSCAGIAAAVTDNTLDVAGACPECALRCIRLLGANGSLIPTSTDVRAFDFAMMHDDVAVVSNSWGFVAGGIAPGPLVDVITQIQTMGHGGLGALVVFAAGNDASTIGSLELQAIPGVVTVGAITQFDDAASFSNMGESLALVSPMGTLTTDIAGAEGEDPGDTTSSFGGTSSACPLVAGVLGLMVSARPTMRAADLRAALIATVRPAPFATPDAMGHDVLYGYGIVDPAAALARIDPDGVPDAGPIDAGHTSSDAGLDASMSDAGSGGGGAGCGCRVATSGSSSGAAIGCVLVALAMLLRSSRARRSCPSSRSLALALALAGCTADRATSAIAAELRPDSPSARDLPPSFHTSDVVETFSSPGGAFRIHFTRAGSNAVPAADANADGTPDFVEYVATQYDMVLARYTSMGFRQPRSDLAVADDNGGDGAFDVYLIDFSSTGGGADGSFRREECVSAMGCAGYMVQENDFVGFGYPSVHYGARLLASHEFFHAVQAAYDDTLGVQGSTLSESTAVWASEQFDPSQNDLEGFSSAFFARPDRALAIDPSGPVPPYAYGAAIVWEYYATRFDDDLVVAFWNQLDMTSGATTSNWLDVLETVLARDYASHFHATYVDFAEWLVFTGSRVDTTRGPARGQVLDEVAASSVTLPFHGSSTRIFPASAHYYSFAGNRVSVRLSGHAPEGVDVIAIGFADGRFVRDARGTGQVDLMAAGADTMIVVLANGATSGSSNMVSICIAAGASECTLDVDAGVADASVLPDAAMTPAPTASCGCGVSGRPGMGALLGFGIVLGTTRLRRRRSARMHRPLCRSSVTT